MADNTQKEPTKCANCGHEDPNPIRVFGAEQTSPPVCLKCFKERCAEVTGKQKGLMRWWRLRHWWGQRFTWESLRFRVARWMTDRHPTLCWGELVEWARGNQTFREALDAHQMCRPWRGQPYAYCGKCEKHFGG